MTLAAAAIYLVLGADPLVATVLGLLTVSFINFVEMWGD